MTVSSRGEQRMSPSVHSMLLYAHIVQASASGIISHSGSADVQ